MKWSDKQEMLRSYNEVFQCDLEDMIVIDPESGEVVENWPEK